MRARSRMSQRALVQRFQSPTDAEGNILTDEYGLALPPDWNTHIASLPCWLYSSTEREAVTEETTAVVADLKALVPLDADVTEQDRIAGITDRAGNVIEPATLGVETVLYKRSHRELTLSRVSS